MDRWSGRVALVTGASAGIGAAICRELVKHGMTVVGCARNVQKIQNMSEEASVKKCPGSIIPIKCDLTNEEEILDMFKVIRERIGRLDVCINNAGLSFDCPLLSGKTEEWKNMLDVNIMALCICTKEAVKIMKENNIEEGQIIHLSSMSAHRIPSLAIYLYAGTKFMVKALTEGHRKELLEDCPKIRIASISPGLVETEFEYRCFSEDLAYARSIYESIKCMEPDDIVQSILYILQAPPHVEVHDILIRPTEQEV